MSVNCSSSNGSLTSAPSSSNVLLDYTQQCYKTTVGSSIVTTFTITSIVFLLPVYIFILHLGFKQWRQQSFSTVAMSHFDLFTYHMVLVELLNVVAAICTCYGIYADDALVMLTGTLFSNEGTSGQLFFHILTCAERYLAVVHPVTYVRLKGEKWNRARHAVVGFVWLLSILATAIILRGSVFQGYVMVFVFTAFELFLILGFSLSVLTVLIHSGPGDRNKGRHHVDPSKLRAFYVLVGFLVALVVRLSWNVVSGSLVLQPNLCESGNCGYLAMTFLFGLPTSLLMPLLYLQRKWRLSRK